MKDHMNILRFSVFGMALLISACAQKSGPATGVDAKPVATVNGQVLTGAQLDFFTKNMAGKQAAELNSEQPAQALDTRVRAEAVAPQGAKAGLDRRRRLGASV